MTARSTLADAPHRKRVAVLISGRGSNMAALIEAAKDPTYPGRDRAGGCRTGPTPAASPPRATPASPPKSSITRTFGKDRAAFDAALQAVLEKHRIELVCLAGFMRLLTAGFRRRSGRSACSTSIRPCCRPSRVSTPTSARWKPASKLHGATVHFVVPEMDAGPIILQGAVAVRARRQRGERWPPGCWRSSTASTRRRSNWWPKGVSALSTGAA